MLMSIQPSMRSTSLMKAVSSRVYRRPSRLNFLVQTCPGRIIHRPYFQALQSIWMMIIMKTKFHQIQLKKKEFQKNYHSGLREIFQNHKFVGCVSKELALIQHQTKLYLVNTFKLSRELFYQLLLLDFGNFGAIRLSEPAPLYDLAMMAFDLQESGWTPADGKKEDLATYVTDFLKSKREMLEEYFALEIDTDGNLCTIPMLLENYVPPLEGLPMYILRLSTEVNWEEEKECFMSFCKETSEFYAFRNNELQNAEPVLASPSQTEEPDQNMDDNWKWTTEHVLFPAYRARCDVHLDDYVSCRLPSFPYRRLGDFGLFDSPRSLGVTHDERLGDHVSC
ncbi:MLH1 [Acanthosepion pharaonis]|uniref:MLH1 n=1 Tax=Acanthosepion pharaonis TaxID=158019 RepID=A0A812CWK4_ACAPH|nr:MLH1 [Sepia pharaonis]